MRPAPSCRGRGRDHCYGDATIFRGRSRVGSSRQTPMLESRPISRKPFGSDRGDLSNIESVGPPRSWAISFELSCDVPAPTPCGQRDAETCLERIAKAEQSPCHAAETQSRLTYKAVLVKTDASRPSSKRDRRLVRSSGWRARRSWRINRAGASAADKFARLHLTPLGYEERVPHLSPRLPLTSVLSDVVRPTSVRLRRSCHR